MATAVLLQINWKLSNLLTEFCIVFHWIRFRNFVQTNEHAVNMVGELGWSSRICSKIEKNQILNEKGQREWATEENRTMMTWMKWWNKFAFGVVGAAVAAMCLCCTFSIRYCVSMLQLRVKNFSFCLLFVFRFLPPFIFHHRLASTLPFFILHSMGLNLSVLLADAVSGVVVAVVTMLLESARMVHRHISIGFHRNAEQTLWIKTFLNY